MDEDSHVKDKTVMRRLIFNMGIPILVRRHLYIEMPPLTPLPWVINHRPMERGSMESIYLSLFNFRADST